MVEFLKFVVLIIVWEGLKLNSLFKLLVELRRVKLICWVIIVRVLMFWLLSGVRVMFGLKLFDVFLI